VTEAKDHKRGSEYEINQNSAYEMNCKQKWLEMEWLHRLRVILNQDIERSDGNTYMVVSTCCELEIEMVLEEREDR
jgi:hypothetical protein